MIAWLDEANDTWQNLATTVNGDGSLSADVLHFTKFVVRFNGKVTDDCGFSACGGDVTGTYAVTGVCAEASAPLLEQCPDVMAEIDLNLTGTATFNDDGTTETNFTSQTTISYTLTAACMDTVTSGMPPASCDELSEPADPESDDGPTTCTGDATVSCTCVQENPAETETKTGTYAASGTTLTMTDDSDGSVSTLEYCIDGSEGRFQQTEGLAVLTWIGTK